MTLRTMCQLGTSSVSNMRHLRSSPHINHLHFIFPWRDKICEDAVMFARSSAICSRFLAPRIASLNSSCRLEFPNGPVKTAAAARQFSTTKMSAFLTPSSDPPKKELVYFPDMTTALPSKSSEFRRVLWTGLYSQLVLMTVPVGGDIGEEVRRRPILSN